MQDTDTNTNTDTITETNQTQAATFFNKSYICLVVEFHMTSLVFSEPI